MQIDRIHRPNPPHGTDMILYLHGPVNLNLMLNVAFAAETGPSAWDQAAMGPSDLVLFRH